MKAWIERQRHFIDFTLSSLLRRKWKNLSLMLVYTFLVLIVASVIFFTSAIKQEAVLTLETAPDMVVQRTIAGRHDLIPISYIEAIKTIPGVNSIKARLWGYYYDTFSKANFTVMAAETFSHEADEAVVGRGVARSRGIIEGDRISLKQYDGKPMILKIVDIYPASSELIASDLIVIRHDAFKRLFGFNDLLATDLALEIRRQEERRTVARKIIDLYPDARPILKDELMRTYTSLFQWRSGFMVVILCGSVLAFFIFAWDKATGLTAEERNEIGILKALGWDASDVVMIKFWEGALISLTSFLVGVILAYFHVFFASSTAFEHALKGWSILYPKFKLIPVIDLDQIILLFFLTVLPYTITTIIPIWRASITDPDIVMR
jgi:ABC-type lipoprotein release transport system permease subunit